MPAECRHTPLCAKHFGTPGVAPAACHQSNFLGILYDIPHDAVRSLSGWFASQKKQQPACSDGNSTLGVFAEKFQYGSRPSMFPGLFQKAPVDARSTSKNLVLLKRCYVFCVRQRLWTRKGLSNFDLCGIWDTSISSAKCRA